ncbi:uncharacterized protein LOC123508914 [Portunus trituberculatus]|uniref:uncharacterized protein LOC123508914 n=1 Tax=Portunus trituberculatus TaxID=210409 RepID=UPI001E1CD415|nr:uncharacterized protein LOC123508914 [Portunus trituberculatus]
MAGYTTSSVNYIGARTSQHPPAFTTPHSLYPALVTTACATPPHPHHCTSRLWEIIEVWYGITLTVAARRGQHHTLLHTTPLHGPNPSHHHGSSNSGSGKLW